MGTFHCWLMCRHSNRHVLSFFYRDLKFPELCLDLGLVMCVELFPDLCLELCPDMCLEVESGLGALRSLR